MTAPKTPERLFQRPFLKILAVLAGTGGLVYLLLYAGTSTSRQVQIRLEEPPESYKGAVYTQNVFFVGSTDRPASLEISRDESKVAEGNTDPDGRFRIGPVTLDPGENSFNLTAKADATFGAVEDSTYLSVSWEPEHPSPPALAPLPAVVNTETVVVRGSTHPNGRVMLSLTRQRDEPAAGVPAPTPEDARLTAVKADGAGRFQTELKLEGAGKYRLGAVVRNSNQVESPAAPEVGFTYDPNWYPDSKAPGRTVERKATLLLSHKRFAVTLEATLPKDDPRVAALLTDKMNVQEFFNRLYGLTFNQLWYTAEFSDVTPHITIDEKNVTVSASSNPRSTIRDIMPVLGGTLQVNGAAGFPLKSSGDSLTVVIKDYTVKSLSPPPTSLNDNQATWAGSDEAGAPGEGIKLQLEYNPLSSPRNFLRLTQLSPYSVWRHPGWVVPMLVNGVLSVLPLIWMLWLLRKYSRLGVLDEPTSGALSPFLRLLVTLSLVYPVVSVARGLTSLIFDYLLPWRVHFSISDHPALYLPTLLAFAFLSLFLRRREGGGTEPRGTWLNNVSRGIRAASLVGIAFCLVGMVGHSFNVIPRMGRLSLSLLNFNVVLYLAACARAAATRLGAPAGRLKRARWVLIGLTLLCAIPVGDMGGWSNFENGFTSFFSIVQDVAPYAPAAMAVLLLRRAKAAGRAARVFVVNLGLLLFSAYLVGTTPNFFMIPVPFLISFWAFRRVVIRDPESRAALDAVSGVVIARRRRWIERVLVNDTAQEFKNNVEQIKAKVLSGDLTPDDFEKRRKQIEAYAREREEKTKLENGLEAKETVLTIGPHAENWKNGKWAVARGSVLVLPFFAVYLFILFLRGAILADLHYPILWNGSLVFTFLADWLLGAFFFGYFFNYIRGESGLKKGLRTSCAIIICLLPTWLSSAGTDIEIVAVFIRAGETFLFYTLLGVWAFDLKTFSSALGERFRWKTFTRFGDMPSFTAVISVLFTSIGVGLTTVLTGQFKDLVAQLVGAALGQHPTGPP
jgi:hypothetical protein